MVRSLSPSLLQPITSSRNRFTLPTPAPNSNRSASSTEVRMRRSTPTPEVRSFDFHATVLRATLLPPFPCSIGNLVVFLLRDYHDGQALFMSLCPMRMRAWNCNQFPVEVYYCFNCEVDLCKLSAFLTKSNLSCCRSFTHSLFQSCVCHVFLHFT